MPIFDKLKSIFIVTDESAGQGVQQSGDKSNDGTDQNPKKAGSPQVSQIPLGQSSERFLEILAQVLEKNNQAGFDYLEYKKAVQSVAKLQNMDESNQFKTAYAAAQAMNVQPLQLIDSAKKYLSILELEEKNFNQSAAQFLQTQISQKENEQKALDLSMKQKSEQIELLKKELAESQKRFDSIQSELQNAKTKVETNQANFVASYAQVVDNIQADIRKMEQYLK
ncbi:MAG: hypothetical protein IPQ10_10945 [Saprospiraceae bacterium]|nr:hypothetical protein [Saprospiraceae bacterium]MBK7797350.1 hypothetical protein [Saprospiraceae bacterium]MBK9377842.1 hypothetical protein [Saprospiraceae bacterium]MBL0261557.1 hypothetical protein [Saprospiraceae bacterium]